MATSKGHLSGESQNLENGLTTFHDSERRRDHGRKATHSGSPRSNVLRDLSVRTPQRSKGTPLKPSSRDSARLQLKTPEKKSKAGDGQNQPHCFSLGFPPGPMGVEFQASSGAGRCTVHRVDERHKGTLMPGDIVLSVDGKQLKGMSFALIIDELRKHNHRKRIIVFERRSRSSPRRSSNLAPSQGLAGLPATPTTACDVLPSTPSTGDHNESSGDHSFLNTLGGPTREQPGATTERAPVTCRSPNQQETRSSGASPLPTPTYPTTVHISLGRDGKNTRTRAIDEKSERARSDHRVRSTTKKSPTTATTTAATPSTVRVEPRRELSEHHRQGDASFPNSQSSQPHPGDEQRHPFRAGASPTTPASNPSSLEPVPSTALPSPKPTPHGGKVYQLSDGLEIRMPPTPVLDTGLRRGLDDDVPRGLGESEVSPTHERRPRETVQTEKHSFGPHAGHNDFDRGNSAEVHSSTLFGDEEQGVRYPERQGPLPHGESGGWGENAECEESTISALTSRGATPPRPSRGGAPNMRRPPPSSSVGGQDQAKSSRRAKNVGKDGRQQRQETKRQKERTAPEQRPHRSGDVLRAGPKASESHETKARAGYGSNLVHETEPTAVPNTLPGDAPGSREDLRESSQTDSHAAGEKVAGRHRGNAAAMGAAAVSAAAALPSDPASLVSFLEGLAKGVGRHHRHKDPHRQSKQRKARQGGGGSDIHGGGSNCSSELAPPMTSVGPPPTPSPPQPAFGSSGHAKSPTRERALAGVEAGEEGGTGGGGSGGRSSSTGPLSNLEGHLPPDLFARWTELLVLNSHPSTRATTTAAPMPQRRDHYASGAPSSFESQRRAPQDAKPTTQRFLEPRNHGFLSQSVPESSAGCAVGASNIDRRRHPHGGCLVDGHTLSEPGNVAAVLRGELFGAAGLLGNSERARLSAEQEAVALRTEVAMLREEKAASACAAGGGGGGSSDDNSAKQMVDDSCLLAQDAQEASAKAAAALDRFRAQAQSFQQGGSHETDVKEDARDTPVALTWVEEHAHVHARWPGENQRGCNGEEMDRSYTSSRLSVRIVHDPDEEDDEDEEEESDVHEGKTASGSYEGSFEFGGGGGFHSRPSEESEESDGCASMTPSDFAVAAAHRRAMTLLEDDARPDEEVSTAAKESAAGLDRGEGLPAQAADRPESSSLPPPSTPPPKTQKAKKRPGSKPAAAGVEKSRGGCPSRGQRPQQEEEEELSPRRPAMTAEEWAAVSEAVAKPLASARKHAISGLVHGFPSPHESSSENGASGGKPSMAAPAPRSGEGAGSGKLDAVGTDGVLVSVGGSSSRGARRQLLCDLGRLSSLGDLNTAAATKLAGAGNDAAALVLRPPQQTSPSTNPYLAAVSGCLEMAQQHTLALDVYTAARMESDDGPLEVSIYVTESEWGEMEQEQTRKAAEDGPAAVENVEHERRREPSNDREAPQKSQWEALPTGPIISGGEEVLMLGQPSTGLLMSPPPAIKPLTKAPAPTDRCLVASSAPEGAHLPPPRDKLCEFESHLNSAPQAVVVPASNVRVLGHIQGVEIVQPPSSEPRDNTLGVHGGCAAGSITEGLRESHGHKVDEALRPEAMVVSSAQMGPAKAPSLDSSAPSPPPPPPHTLARPEPAVGSVAASGTMTTAEERAELASQGLETMRAELAEALESCDRFKAAAEEHAAALAHTTSELEKCREQVGVGERRTQACATRAAVAEDAVTRLSLELDGAKEALATQTAREQAELGAAAATVAAAHQRVQEVEQERARAEAAERELQGDVVNLQGKLEATAKDLEQRVAVAATQAKEEERGAWEAKIEAAVNAAVASACAAKDAEWGRVVEAQKAAEAVSKQEALELLAEEKRALEEKANAAAAAHRDQVEALKKRGDLALQSLQQAQEDARNKEALALASTAGAASPSRGPPCAGGATPPADVAHPSPLEPGHSTTRAIALHTQESGGALVARPAAIHMAPWSSPHHSSASFSASPSAASQRRGSPSPSQRSPSEAAARAEVLSLRENCVKLEAELARAQERLQRQAAAHLTQLEEVRRLQEAQRSKQREALKQAELLASARKASSQALLVPHHSGDHNKDALGVSNESAGGCSPPSRSASPVHSMGSPTPLRRHGSTHGEDTDAWIEPGAGALWSPPLPPRPLPLFASPSPGASGIGGGGGGGGRQDALATPTSPSIGSQASERKKRRMADLLGRMDLEDNGGFLLDRLMSPGAPLPASSATCPDDATPASPSNETSTAAAAIDEARNETANETTLALAPTNSIAANSARDRQNSNECALLRSRVAELEQEVLLLLHQQQQQQEQQRHPDSDFISPPSSSPLSGSPSRTHQGQSDDGQANQENSGPESETEESCRSEEDEEEEESAEAQELAWLRRKVASLEAAVEERASEAAEQQAEAAAAAAAERHELATELTTAQEATAAALKEATDAKALAMELEAALGEARKRVEELQREAEELSCRASAEGVAHREREAEALKALEDERERCSGLSEELAEVNRALASAEERASAAEASALEASEEAKLAVDAAADALEAVGVVEGEELGDEDDEWSTFQADDSHLQEEGGGEGEDEGGCASAAEENGASSSAPSVERAVAAAVSEVEHAAALANQEAWDEAEELRRRLAQALSRIDTLEHRADSPATCGVEDSRATYRVEGDGHGASRAGPGGGGHQSFDDDDDGSAELGDPSLCSFAPSAGREDEDEEEEEEEEEYGGRAPPRSPEALLVAEELRMKLEAELKAERSSVVELKQEIATLKLKFSSATAPAEEEEKGVASDLSHQSGAEDPPPAPGVEGEDEQENRGPASFHSSSEVRALRQALTDARAQAADAVARCTEAEDMAGELADAAEHAARDWVLTARGGGGGDSGSSNDGDEVVALRAALSEALQEIEELKLELDAAEELLHTSSSGSSSSEGSDGDAESVGDAESAGAEAPTVAPGRGKNRLVRTGGNKNPDGASSDGHVASDESSTEVSALSLLVDDHERVVPNARVYRRLRLRVKRDKALIADLGRRLAEFENSRTPVRAADSEKGDPGGRRGVVSLRIRQFEAAAVRAASAIASSSSPQTAGSGGGSGGGAAFSSSSVPTSVSSSVESLEGCSHTDRDSTRPKHHRQRSRLSTYFRRHPHMVDPSAHARSYVAMLRFLARPGNDATTSPPTSVDFTAQMGGGYATSPPQPLLAAAAGGAQQLPSSLTSGAVTGRGGLSQAQHELSKNSSDILKASAVLRQELQHVAAHAQRCRSRALANTLSARARAMKQWHTRRAFALWAKHTSVIEEDRDGDFEVNVCLQPTSTSHQEPPFQASLGALSSPPRYSSTATNSPSQGAAEASSPFDAALLRRKHRMASARNEDGKGPAISASAFSARPHQTGQRSRSPKFPSPPPPPPLPLDSVEAEARSSPPPPPGTLGCPDDALDEAPVVSAHPLPSAARAPPEAAKGKAKKNPTKGQLLPLVTALAARQQRLARLVEQGDERGDDDITRHSSRARQSHESEDGSSFWALSSDEEAHT